MSSNIPTDDEIRQQLDRMLASKTFAHVEAGKFLRFVVEQRLERKGEISQSSLAEHLYNESKADRHLSKADLHLKVRTRASDVRNRLLRYYAKDGADDTAVIDLPLHGYDPQFRYREVPSPTSTPAPAPPSTVNRPRLSRVAAGALVVAAGLAAWFVYREYGTHSPKSPGPGVKVAQAAPMPKREAKDVGALRAEGWEAFNREEFLRTSDLTTEAIRRNPDDSESWHLRGMANRRMGKLDAAESDLKKEISLKPTYPLAHYELALVRVDQHQDVAAIDHLNTAITLGDSDPKADLFYQTRGMAHLRLADALKMESHLDAAFSDFDTACRRNKEDGWAFAARGAVYLRRGKFRLARPDFDRALKLLPPDPSVLLDSARVWKGLGDSARAAKDEERARALLLNSK
jgi:tetratricopeptide (TPR) repeat protein